MASFATILSVLSIYFCVCQGELYNIDFTLYKNGNMIRSDDFDPTIPTQIYIHDAKAGPKTAEKYCDSLYKVLNINCVAIDWTGMSADLLDGAGSRLKETVEYFVRKGLKLSDLTMIGHGVGAHLAGITAKKLKESNGLVSVIIALDPSTPEQSYREWTRLDRSDASYVQVMHTDIGGGAWKDEVGHADIFVNWGDKQPGCYRHACSHERAQEIWFEALKTDFSAYLCKPTNSIYDAHYFKSCNPIGTKTILGPNAEKAEGTFYLETNEESPYAIDDVKFFRNY